MIVLVTGASGLIGSAAVEYYDGQGHNVHGIDNNMRRELFGPKGDTTWNLRRLLQVTKNYRHHDMDVRNRQGLFDLFKRWRYDMIIHCAAQPSHDKAREIPLVDFDVNVVGTVNLLEATRQYAPEAVFIYMSTNKVYGNAPNELSLVELETRFEYERPEDYHGIDEECRIDRSLHSLFGASKAAADLIAQEYGKSYGMKVGIFRGGCLTGPSHSGVELHGFLSYLVRVAVTGRPYSVYGYKGKQVRDQIHSYDVVSLFEEFTKAPHPGEVYNVGGSRENAASILECFGLIRNIGGYEVDWRYMPDNRIGDHICYISDIRKARMHYPQWSISRPLDSIIAELIKAEEARLAI
jgi:CDP-paratose 2-epimerase